MAGRQPILTALPAYGPRYHPDSAAGKHDAKQLKLGRTLREARAGIPPDEWEAWLQANCAWLLERDVLFGTDFGAKWESPYREAEHADGTGEELIAQCRKNAAARLAGAVEKERCRAPETPAEQDIVDRYLDMEAVKYAVRCRVGYQRGGEGMADPPRLRALAKRLRKRGLVPAHVRYERDEKPKLSRADRAWEKAKQYWTKKIDEHGEELARRMWAVTKAARAARAYDAAYRNLADPLARLAFSRWQQGGVGSVDAVLEVAPAKPG
jgi:hypothetical protein